ncbi:MAG: hypothetical protein JXA14_03940 [Anaerolineae bacterium]|nr:hypothetical protein [Anaerolineae bacterium]
MSSKAAVVLAVLAVAAQTFCCGAILGSPTPPYTVDPSDETLDHLQEQVETIEADHEGKFTITITEEEMTALAVQMLEEMEDPPPISQPQVLFRDGRVELYGTIHVTDSTDVPGMLALTLNVQDGDIVVTVEEIDVGPLPVPESFTETATENLNQALDDRILSNMTDYVITDVEIGDKKAVIYGQVLDE